MLPLTVMSTVMSKAVCNGLCPESMVIMPVTSLYARTSWVGFLSGSLKVTTDDSEPRADLTSTFR